MLLELAQWMEQYVRAFNVFSYLTLRAVLACLTSLLISFMIGPTLIRKLTAYKIGQSVRDDGPLDRRAGGFLGTNRRHEAGQALLLDCGGRGVRSLRGCVLGFRDRSGGGRCSGGVCRAGCHGHAQHTTDDGHRHTVFMQLAGGQFDRQFTRAHQGHGVVDQAAHVGAAACVHGGDVISRRATAGPDAAAPR